MNIILTMARLTFREAIRRRIVLAALVMGAAFLVIYGLGFHFISEEIAREFAQEAGSRAAASGIQNEGLNFLVMAGLYVVNFLCVATAALITADSLAGEIQSGTIQAIVTKPIRRVEVVLGKWLGHAVLLLLYLIYLGGGTLLIVWALSGYLPNRWPVGLALLYLNGLLILSLTLAFSSSLSTLATGGAVFGAYGLSFIGGWMERIGSALQNQTAVQVGIFSSLLLPSEAIWSKAARLMGSPLMTGMGMSPFNAASEPSNLMMIYIGLYLIAMLALAVRRFGKRDL